MSQRPLSRPSDPAPRVPRLVDVALPERVAADPAHAVLGVFPGDGIGPEIVAITLNVLDAVCTAFGREVEVHRGGPIGYEAEAATGTPLPPEAAELCAAVFERGGAILQGPGGGRFVYDLRRRFDLFCKLVPLRPHAALSASSRFRPEHLDGVDILVVRDNAGGVYQGTWQAAVHADGRVATHTFGYSERQVQAIVKVAARLALARRGELLVVAKDGGVPSISRLWRDVAHEEARRAGVALRVANLDLAAYMMMHEPRALDVIVTPNLVGDVLADIGAVLEGGRGVAFSGNFTPAGRGVFQTSHGAALDLAGSDKANPVGQILSLAMLLREGFGWLDAAGVVEAAVDRVWREGLTTADLPLPGARVVGCAELGARIADAALALGRDAG